MSYGQFLRKECKEKKKRKKKKNKHKNANEWWYLPRIRKWQRKCDAHQSNWNSSDNVHKIQIKWNSIDLIGFQLFYGWK